MDVKVKNYFSNTSFTSFRKDSFSNKNNHNFSVIFGILTSLHKYTYTIWLYINYKTYFEGSPSSYTYYLSQNEKEQFFLNLFS